MRVARSRYVGSLGDTVRLCWLWGQRFALLSCAARTLVRFAHLHSQLRCENKRPLRHGVALGPNNNNRYDFNVSIIIRATNFIFSESSRAALLIGLGRESLSATSWPTVTHDFPSTMYVFGLRTIITLFSYCTCIARFARTSLGVNRSKLERNAALRAASVGP